MPLSRPESRSLLHSRDIACRGYRRSDGLWDFEGHLADVKSRDVHAPGRGGFVPAGEPFHQMSLRLTVDETLQVRAVEASIDQAPFPTCAGITAAFRRLEGTRIGPGWSRLIKERLGGVQGCTHLSELLVPIATTAFQTLWQVQDLEGQIRSIEPLLNSCHTWDAEGELVSQQLPEYLAQLRAEKEGSGFA